MSDKVSRKALRGILNVRLSTIAKDGGEYIDGKRDAYRIALADLESLPSTELEGETGYTRWLVGGLSNQTKEIERLRAENERLQAALEWYADKEHYETWEGLNVGLTNDVSYDGGERARKALSLIREEAGKESTASSLLKHCGTWVGDDLEERLAEVKEASPQKTNDA
jgi:hypothetical protein